MTSSHPTLSIITAVYNGERFMEECIMNVMAQVCDQAEHIIIDGKSTDGTAEIIKKHAERYPHIRWVSEKDGGQSEAMNKGIAMSRGDILSFLNVDDLYEPGVFKRILEIFKTMPEPGIVAGNCNIWDAAGKFMGLSKPEKLRLDDLLLGFDINPHPVNPSSYFYHRSLHDRVGPYKVDVNYAMDQEFLFRAVQKAHVKYVNEVWGNFRIFEGTKTANDIKTGKIKERDMDIIREFRKQLPLLRRWRVIFLYGYLHSRFGRILQATWRYLLNPAGISGMVRRKILKLTTRR